MDYRDYQHLRFERRERGVVLVTINRPEVLNATNDRLHWELTQVWLTLDADETARVALVTGAGRAFSAGGDLEMVEANSRDPKRLARTIREASDIVYNMINLDKPVVSAINGVAVGAGLVVALLADISIMSESARITDGHTKLGVVAGDHAAILWPLLCGMAKAKYYLLTSDFIDGREAERIGLVSLCVPHDELMAKASEVTERRGVRPSLVAGQVLTGAMVVVAALARDLAAMLVCLVIAGFGFAVLNPATGKAIVEWFPPRERGRAMGIKQAGLTFGGMAS